MILEIAFGIVLAAIIIVLAIIALSWFLAYREEIAAISFLIFGFLAFVYFISSEIGW